MTDDNVIQFPGATYGKITPKTVAEALLKEYAENLESILWCGFTKEGQFIFASSEGELKDNLWILENARMEIWGATLGDDE